MNDHIKDIAQRIRELRDIMGFSQDEMAKSAGISAEEYNALENGEKDFSFTFIYKCAEKFNVDIVELLTGENPHLSFYDMTRKGGGLPMERRSGFKYYHLGARLKNKLCEPFLVAAPYKEEEQNQPIHLSTHEGQEFDYILKGSLKVVLDSHTHILNEGDSIYYDSSHGHGMIAVNGEECLFLAIILKKN